MEIDTYVLMTASIIQDVYIKHSVWMAKNNLIPIKIKKSSVSNKSLDFQKLQQVSSPSIVEDNDTYIVGYYRELGRRFSYCDFILDPIKFNYKNITITSQSTRKEIILLIKDFSLFQLREILCCCMTNIMTMSEINDGKEPYDVKNGCDTPASINHVSGQIGRLKTIEEIISNAINTLTNNNLKKEHKPEDNHSPKYHDLKTRYLKLQSNYSTLRTELELSDTKYTDLEKKYSELLEKSIYINNLIKYLS